MTLSSRTSTSKVAISHPRFGAHCCDCVYMAKTTSLLSLIYEIPLDGSDNRVDLQTLARQQEPAFITSRHVCLTECASGSSRLTSLNMHIPHPPGQRHPSTWDRVILHHLEEVSYGGKSQTEVLESILFCLFIFGLIYLFTDDYELYAIFSSPMQGGSVCQVFQIPFIRSIPFDLLTWMSTLHLTDDLRPMRRA